MSANIEDAAEGTTPYGFARRWDLAEDDVLVLDLRDEDYNPYLGVSYVGRPVAGAMIVPEGHLGELDENGALDPDGWHKLTLPSRGDAITDTDGEGDVMAPCPLAALRFTVSDAAGKVWVTLGGSPHGTPVGAGKR